MKDFKKDLEIAKHELDKEWINQPILFVEWAEQAVNASFVKDKAKERLDLTRAEVDFKIRSNPSKYGIEKITESVVTNTIITSKEYKAANDNYLNAIKEAKILDVAREAFDHKKKALERLTDLFLAGYWSNPNIKKEVKEQFEQENVNEMKKVLRSNKRLNSKEEV